MKPRFLILPLALLATPLGAQAQGAIPQASAAVNALEPSETDPVELTWIDYDADGRLDALTIGPEGQLTLLRRRNDQTFEDATSFAGLSGVGGVVYVLGQDYDNDELVDLVVGQKDGAITLWKNFGGSFTDVTTEVGLDLHGGEHVTGKPLWIDYDSDGIPDLAVATEAGTTIHVGNSTGGFRPERAAVAGAQAATITRGTSALTTSISGTPTTTGSGTVPFVNCVPRVLDAATGACIETSSVATLGALFPISDELFVDSVNGLVGVNTTNPLATLTVESDQTPVAPLQPIAAIATLSVISRDSLVAAIGQTQGGHSASFALREVSPVDGSLVSTWGLIRETTVGGALKVTIGPDTYPGVNQTVMSFEVNGDVGIGTEDPEATLDVNGDARINGFLRMGSETGTSQPPNQNFTYEGVVVRRCISTTTLAGSVVARSQSLRLERDGSPGRFRLAWDAGAIPNQMVTGTALRANGTIIPIVLNVGAPISSGSQALYSEPDVVQLDVMFGTVFNARAITEVKLMRQDGDSWWVGSLTSTFDQ